MKVRAEGIYALITYITVVPRALTTTTTTTRTPCPCYSLRPHPTNSMPQLQLLFSPYFSYPCHNICSYSLPSPYPYFSMQLLQSSTIKYITLFQPSFTFLQRVPFLILVLPLSLPGSALVLTSPGSHHHFLAPVTASDPSPVHVPASSLCSTTSRHMCLSHTLHFTPIPPTILHCSTLPSTDTPHNGYQSEYPSFIKTLKNNPKKSTWRQIPGI